MDIKLAGLSCGYAKEPIIKELTLELASLGHLTVLGANGSGKSTLAKALCGLLPYRGSIRLDNQELKNLDPKSRAKSIAYIPSKLESFEQYTTVEDFVLMGRYAHKEPFRDYSSLDKELTQERLRELTIEHLASKKVHELSSGQQQLVLIAQALAQESSIIIFDEPTANLDPKNSRFFAKTLQALQSSHTTVLITHDLSLASYIGGAVLFLDHGAAHYYPQSRDFFTRQNLQRCYDAPFSLHQDILGVSYA